MALIVAGLLFGYLLLLALRNFSKADPKVLKRLLRRSCGYGIMLAAAILLVVGQFGAAVAMGLIGFWWMGSGISASAPLPGRKPGISRLRSAMIEMEYDQASGKISGGVLAGIYEGRALDDLPRGQCMDLYANCRHMDAAGARLLETYFDRRFSGWRAARQGKADSGQGRERRVMPGAMSQDEAYEILGLRQGSGREDIVRAHRTLIKKWHPDHGGSTDLAARVNEAKDVLLRKHNS